MRSHGNGHANGDGVLLTGSTGFLGGEVLARLLERGDGPVYALVRAGSEPEARARVGAVVRSLLGRTQPWSRRVVPVAGDIGSPGLGMDRARREWLAERVGRIVHCAATVSFTLGLEESRAVNVEGTRNMLDLAELCSQRGGLDCFTHVSTAYVAGDHTGVFREQDLDVGQEFRNAYERSKYEAEVAVRERGRCLPVQVLRPSIIVGDSRTGWTSSFNVLYTPLRAFARGAYPAIPARRSSPVDVVPVDYVADSILALSGRPGTTYHLTAGPSATTVGEIIEIGSGHFDRRPPRVLPPWLYRRAIQPILVRRLGDRQRRALLSSAALFPYFAMRVRYDNSRAREALTPAGLEAPPLPSYFHRLVEHALAADWGRRPVARHEAVPGPQQAGGPGTREGAPQDAFSNVLAGVR